MKLRRQGYYWGMGGQMGQQGGHCIGWWVSWFDQWCSLKGKKGKTFPGVLIAVWGDTLMCFEPSKASGAGQGQVTRPLEPQKHWSLSIEVAPGSIAGSWIEIRLQRQSPYWLSYCLATEDNKVVHDEQCGAEPFHFMQATNFLVHKTQDINCGKLTDLLKK